MPGKINENEIDICFSTTSWNFSALGSYLIISQWIQNIICYVFKYSGISLDQGGI